MKYFLKLGKCTTNGAYGSCVKFAMNHQWYEVGGCREERIITQPQGEGHMFDGYYLVCGIEEFRFFSGEAMADLLHTSDQNNF